MYTVNKPGSRDLQINDFYFYLHFTQRPVLFLVVFFGGGDSAILLLVYYFSLSLPNIIALLKSHSFLKLLQAHRRKDDGVTRFLS